MCDFIEPIGKIDNNTYLIAKKGSRGFLKFEVEGEYDNQNDLENSLNTQETLSWMLIQFMGPMWIPAKVVITEKDKDDYLISVITIPYSDGGNLAITANGLKRQEDIKREYVLEKGQKIEIIPYTSDEIAKLEEIDSKDIREFYEPECNIILENLHKNCLMVKLYNSVDEIFRFTMYDTALQSVNANLSGNDYVNNINNVYNQARSLFPNSVGSMCDDKFTLVMEYHPRFLTQNFNDDQQFIDDLNEFLSRAVKTGTYTLPDELVLATDSSYQNFFLVNPDIMSPNANAPMYSAIKDQLNKKSLKLDDVWKCDDQSCSFTGNYYF